MPQVSAPLGFSGTDPLVVLHAPCFAAISKYQPCAVLRSADGGHTWTAVNVTAPGGEEGESYDAPDVPNNRKYIRLWAASFSEGASSGGITSGCCLPLDWADQLARTVLL